MNKLSLNTSKTNFMVFTNRSCDDTYTVCMNGLNLSRVFVTKFLGVHMDSKLDWNYHIDIVRNKVAKNVSVINRVKHILTSSALYSMYIGGSREGPGGTCPPPLENWTVPLLHGFHRRIQRRAYWGHVPPRPYWTVPLLRGF